MMGMEEGDLIVGSFLHLFYHQVSLRLGFTLYHLIFLPRGESKFAGESKSKIEEASEKITRNERERVELQYVLGMTVVTQAGASLA